MTISVPPDKVVQLRALLDQWPADRRRAPVAEVRRSLGRLLHLSEIVQPDKFFVRRILNQLGLEPFTPGTTDDRVDVGGRRRQGLVRLSLEIHADLDFWRVILDMATEADGVTRLEAFLLACYLQPPTRIIDSDASGDAMGGYCLETGRWWRMDFSAGARSCLRRGL